MNQLGETKSDARLCHNQTIGGYSDWYMPSKDELNELYLNQGVLNTITNGSFYWSSSEYDASNAWYQNFYNGPGGGGQSWEAKNNFGYVRCVRSF